MLTREDAIKAHKLFELIDDLHKRIELIKSAETFKITLGFSEAFIPVESSIARQIGYKYCNDKIDEAKNELERLGFMWDIKLRPYKDIKLFGEAGLTIKPSLNEQYRQTYGEWPKKETTSEGEEK